MSPHCVVNTSAEVNTGAGRLEDRQVNPKGVGEGCQGKLSKGAESTAEWEGHHHHSKKWGSNLSKAKKHGAFRAPP